MARGCEANGGIPGARVLREDEEDDGVIEEELDSRPVREV